MIKLSNLQNKPILFLSWEFNHQIPLYWFLRMPVENDQWLIWVPTLDIKLNVIFHTLTDVIVCSGVKQSVFWTWGVSISLIFSQKCSHSCEYVFFSTLFSVYRIWWICEGLKKRSDRYFWVWGFRNKTELTLYHIWIQTTRCKKLTICWTVLCVL